MDRSFRSWAVAFLLFALLLPLVAKGENPSWLERFRARRSVSWQKSFGTGKTWEPDYSLRLQRQQQQQNISRRNAEELKRMQTMAQQKQKLQEQKHRNDRQRRSGPETHFEWRGGFGQMIPRAMDHTRKHWERGGGFLGKRLNPAYSPGILLQWGYLGEERSPSAM